MPTVVPCVHPCLDAVFERSTVWSKVMSDYRRGEDKQ